MKKVLILVVLLLVVGGGVIAGLTYMGIGPLADGSEGAAEEQQVVDAVPPARMIDMDTLGVPVFEGGAVTRRVFINVALDVDPAQAERVSALKPRIHSAFLTDMMAFLPVHLRSRDSADHTAIKQRMLIIARKIAGNSAVRNVLVKNSFDR